MNMKTVNIYNKVKRLKKLTKLGCAAFLVFSLSQSLIFLTSCSDWDDHYEPDAASGSNLTLWQQLQANSQLSDFCQVLDQTKVFRMHKKTSVSYAQLLDGGQSFTVVAPVNGTFNRDSLLQLVQTNQGDSVVEKFFVLNHLSRSNSSLNGEEQSMLLLNSKFVKMANGKIEGVGVTTPNCHAKNGVLHVTEGPLPYEYNLYEALCDIPEFSSIGSLLRQYEEDYFDADASVSSGIVEGEPVYVDSVVIEYNKMLEYIGLINAEDSTYWVLAPTKAEWEQAWDEAKNYFVYDQSVLKRDSLQQYWTARALLDNAIFNMTDQLSVEDSLVSIRYLVERPYFASGKPVGHVFHKPFAAGGILDGAEAIKCSNGQLYKTPRWPFTPEQTYLREVWSEGESIALILSDKDCTYNPRRLVADSISENSYLQIVPRSSIANWDLTFRLNNVLSGTYDICAVLLPKSVANQDNPDMRPCKFKATINYLDETGAAKSFNCDNKQFQSNPERVDTIVLAEAFHFPVSNFGETAISFSIKLSCAILARETSKYAREMYLDCIYLRPRNENNNQ